MLVLHRAPTPPRAPRAGQAERFAHARAALGVQGIVPSVVSPSATLKSVATSVPEPPPNWSAPGPPVSRSLPLPPDRLSLPLPPDRLSLPPPPDRLSSPPPPDRLSLPLPPHSRS